MEAVLLLSVYVMPRSIQRGAFFLTVEGQKDDSACSQQSLWIALSSTGMNQVRRCHTAIVRCPPTVCPGMVGC